jgi:hypothetical protein
MLLSREYIVFLPVVAFVVLGSVCSVPPRRVSRYAGTDVMHRFRSYSRAKLKRCQYGSSMAFISSYSTCCGEDLRINFRSIVMC